MTFRNTELIYSNAIANLVRGMGFRAVLAEGVDRILAGRTPDRPYAAAGAGRSPLTCLLRNYRLADDIGFRFLEVTAHGGHLDPGDFAQRLHAASRDAVSINLFLDYETFGEHFDHSSGIMDFLSRLPDEILRHRNLRFATPADVLAEAPPEDVLDVPENTSWADSERDTSAWLGNEMQRDAAQALYALEKRIQMLNYDCLRVIWRRLQASDHLYYMATKGPCDGAVHRHFSPYPTAYDAYVNFMRVLAELEYRVDRAATRSA